MLPLAASDVLLAFLKKKQKLVYLPKLDSIDWHVLYYLGWSHPSGHLGYVVFNDRSHMRGIIFEKTKMTGAQKPRMCSWCLTVHRGCGVSLFTSQTEYDKNIIVGEYICSNLNCSLYIRKILVPDACQMRENIDLNARIARLQANVGKFFSIIYDKKHSVS